MSEGHKMQVSVERVSDVQRKMAVEIPWEEVKGRLDDAYRELGDGVSLKGFRRGKVPRRMLENLFGKHVHKEVAQRLVQESMVKALSDNSIAPIGEPEIQDDGIADGDAFRFSAVVQVVPELPVNDYFGVDVKQRSAKVTDEQVAESLKAKQEQHTQFRPIEGRTSKNGDVITVDLLGKVGDRPVAVEEQQIELGNPQAEPLPGLSEQLLNLAPDTKELSVELTVPMPGEQGDAAVPVKARLLVTVRGINEKIVPALDDEFAKDTGEAESLADLQKKLRAELLQADEQKAREEAKRTLIQTLLEKNPVPDVPALAEKQLERMVQIEKILFQLQYGNQGVHEEMLKERLRADANQIVKRGLLLEAIAKKEKLQVSEGDIEKRLKDLAESRGQNLAKVRSEYDKEGRLDALKSAILEEKTLELLISKANITVSDEL